MTRRSTYAVRALVVLAQAFPQAQPSSVLARRAGVPRPFLENLLRRLAQHGVLVARRGRAGGYALRPGWEGIDAATVIRILEGPVLRFRCLDPVRPSRCVQCPGNLPCSARLILEEMTRASEHALGQITLGDLARRTEPDRVGLLEGLASSSLVASQGR
jgi:Rrf2 family protein